MHFWGSQVFWVRTSQDPSLEPRPSTHAKRDRLLKSKSLGLLQNLKATNEIVKRHLLEEFT